MSLKVLTHGGELAWMTLALPMLQPQVHLILCHQSTPTDCGNALKGILQQEISRLSAGLWNQKPSVWWTLRDQ